MDKRVNDFIDWWLEAPLYKSILLSPFVAVLYMVAILINLFGENKQP